MANSHQSDPDSEAIMEMGRFYRNGLLDKEQVKRMLESYCDNDRENLVDYDAVQSRTSKAADYLCARGFTVTDLGEVVRVTADGVGSVHVLKEELPQLADAFRTARRRSAAG